MGGQKSIRRLGAALALRDGCALYAELAREGSELSVVNAHMLALPSWLLRDDHIQDAPALGAFLRKELAFRWQQLPLAIGIPSSDCDFRSITLPEIDLNEIRSAIYWNFSDYFVQNVADTLFDVCVANLPNSRLGKVDVLVAASQRSKLMPLFDALTNSRSCVSAAEPQIVACARALGPDAEDSEKLTLLVLPLQCAAHIVLFYGDSGILFRTIPLKKSPSDFECVRAVHDEILKTMDYASQSSGSMKVEKIYVAASEDMLTALVSMKDLGAEVIKRSLKDRFSAALSAPASESWFDVAGLLMRHSDEDQF